MKLVWLTDLHLQPRGEMLYGYETVKRLEHAIRYIIKYHSDADFCMLSGDLINKGNWPGYQLIDEIMSRLPLPYLVIPGNHDDRAAMREHLLLPEHVSKEFIQYSITKDGCRLVALDTLHPDHSLSLGLLCKERLAWLKLQLADDVSTPTIIFAHHHPDKLHLPLQDDGILLNGDELLDILCKADNVKHLFFGHVHRAVSGSFKNLGFTALQSATFQAPLPYPSWDWDSFSPAQEPPALGIIHFSSSSVITHFHPFCKAEDYQVS